MTTHLYTSENKRQEWDFYCTSFGSGNDAKQKTVCWFCANSESQLGQKWKKMLKLVLLNFLEQIQFMKQVICIMNCYFTNVCKVHFQLLNLHVQMNSHSIAKYQQYHQALYLYIKNYFELNIQSFPAT